MQEEKDAQAAALDEPLQKEALRASDSEEATPDGPWPGSHAPGDTDSEAEDKSEEDKKPEESKKPGGNKESEEIKEPTPEKVPEGPRLRKPVTSRQPVKVNVENKGQKGLLLLDRQPWVIELPDGRQVSPSEFERLAGSLRKNWKSSTHIVQDGKVGMTVGNWLNAQGIALPAKLVRAAPRPSAEPESAKPAGRAEKLPIRKAANPEKHLADLRALLELHGKKLDQAWAVEYTDIVRKNAIDQDPYYVAPEGFVPDKTEQPNFSGRNYNSRVKVAQAHGIPQSALNKRPTPVSLPDSNAKPDAKKQRRIKAETESEDEDDQEDDEPPARRTRTAAAAEAILSGKNPKPGPISPGTTTQDAGAEALLQLRSLDQQQPADGGEKQAKGVDSSQQQQQSVPELFIRLQTYICIVEIDGDDMKRKKIREYMKAARGALEELRERLAHTSS